MKKIYFKNLSLAMVLAFTLSSCNKDAKVDVSSNTPIESTNNEIPEGAPLSPYAGLDVSAVKNLDYKKQSSLFETSDKQNSVKPEKQQDINISLNESKDKSLENRALKGIEEIALYREQIAKKIGEDKPRYEKGYLMAEYQKAEANLSRNAYRKKNLYSVQFNERGPANVPGRARSVKVNPSDLNNWFVGSAGGGIWETTDAGKTWFNKTDYAIPNLATPSIDIPISEPNTIYAGTGEPYGNLDAIGGFGLVKSTDGGESWTYLESSSKMGDVGRLVVNPDDANMVVVGSVNGIYKSTDGGANWTKTKSNVYIQDLIYKPGDFNTIFASHNGIGVWKSTDAGETWNLAFDVKDYNEEISRMEIDISTVNTNKLLIAAYASGNSGYYISNDEGTTFTEIKVKKDSDGTILNAQGWYDNALSFHPYDENIFYNGGIYMAKFTIDPADNTYETYPIAGGYSTDGNKINLYVHVDMQDIIFVKNPNNSEEFRLILTSDGGVYYTDYSKDPGVNEGDWSELAIGMNSTQFYGADKKNGENKYVAGAQDNGSWASLINNPDKNSEYVFLNGGDGFEALWNYENGDRVLVTSQYNNIVNIDVSTGNGFYARHGDYGSGKSPFYSKITNTNNNPNVVFSPSANGVWRSTTFGADWELTEINEKWTPNNSASSALDVSVSSSNPDVVWAGVAMTESSSYTIHVSLDNGQTFTPIKPFVDPRGGDFSHFYYISGLGTSPTNAKRAYILTSAYSAAKVLRTNDLGETWEDISGFSTNEDRGFPNVAVHSILEMPFNENIIWAGTDIGIFETTDGGNSWNILDDFLPVSVFDMKFVNDQVVISTHGRGVWTATIPELLNFEYSNYINPPIIESFAQASITDLKASIKYNYSDSEITAIKLFIDDEFVTTISSGLEPNKTLSYVTDKTYSEGNHKVEILGVYGNAEETIKSNESATFIQFNDGKSNFAIQEFVPEDIVKFDDNNFVVDQVIDQAKTDGRFSYNILNNVGHPYETSRSYTSYIRTPFINTDKGILTIEHMALTEANYDYAYVEASTDLENWVEIAKFTEASHEDKWKRVNAPDIKEELFIKDDLDFSKDFNEGDEIVIRLRLESDVFVTRYGWLIKSLVNENKLAVDEVINVDESSTAKIAPNPVKKDINIYLSNKSLESVDVEIYDISGRLLNSYKDLRTISGSVTIPFKKVNPGNYIAVIKTDEFTKSIKFLKE